MRQKPSIPDPNAFLQAKKGPQERVREAHDER